MTPKFPAPQKLCLPFPPFSRIFRPDFIGQVSERSNEHDWKSCVRQKRTEGSNPSLSAQNQARIPPHGGLRVFQYALAKAARMW